MDYTPTNALTEEHSQLRYDSIVKILSPTSLEVHDVVNIASPDEDKSAKKRLMM